MVSSNVAVASSLLLSQEDMSPVPTRTAELAAVGPSNDVADGIWDMKITSKDVVNRRTNLFIFLLRKLYYQSLMKVIGSSFARESVISNLL
jgi:hypothetical protein